MFEHEVAYVVLYHLIRAGDVIQDVVDVINECGADDPECKSFKVNQFDVSNPDHFEYVLCNCVFRKQVDREAVAYFGNVIVRNLFLDCIQNKKFGSELSARYAIDRMDTSTDFFKNVDVELFCDTLKKLFPATWKKVQEKIKEFCMTEIIADFVPCAGALGCC